MAIQNIISNSFTVTKTTGGGNIPVTGVTLNTYNASITNGGTYQLTATINPSNATNKSVTWTTLNDQFLSVNSNGLVTGLQAGTGKRIRVTTADGGFVADCTFEITSTGGGGGTTPTGDNPIQQQYSNSHEAKPNNPNPPTGAYNWVDRPRINPDGSFPQSTWNAIGHWMTTYKVENSSYQDNVGLLLQDPKAWIWNTSTNKWDVLSDNFEFGTWYREDFWDDGNGNIANTTQWETGVSANRSKWVKIKQTSETSGRCFHPWGYQKNWRSNSAWANNGQPYIVTKIDFKLVKWNESGADNLANARLVVNSGADWWRNVGDSWQPDWSTNRDMAVGKYLLATTDLKRAYCTNLPQNWSNGFPE